MNNIYTSQLPSVTLSGVAAACRQGISTTLSQSINTVAPTIVSEAFYHVFKRVNPLMVAWQYDRVCNLNPSLPHYTVTLPFMVGMTACQMEPVKQTRLGGFINRHQQKILDAAHLALAGLEIAYGKKVEGATHIITWAYFNAPRGSTSPKVDTIARRLIAAAFVVTTANFFYNRPLLMLALIVTPVAFTALMIHVSVELTRKAFRWTAENVFPNNLQYQAICLDFALNFWTATGKLITGRYVVPVVGPLEKA